MRRLLLRALFLAAIVSWSSTPGALAGEDEAHDFEVVDAGSIYYGTGKHPRTPAVITADSVWAEIPEYKRIVDENLTEDDPQYHLLMKKASERFDKALRKVASRDGYDMIGETGSIEAKGKGEKKKDIPDITDDLIEIVTRE